MSWGVSGVGAGGPLHFQFPFELISFQIRRKEEFS